MNRGPKENIEHELRRLKEACNSLILRLEYSHNGKQCFVELTREDINTMIEHRNINLRKGYFN